MQLTSYVLFFIRVKLMSSWIVHENRHIDNSFTILKHPSPFSLLVVTSLWHLQYVQYFCSSSSWFGSTEVCRVIHLDTEAKGWWSFSPLDLICLTVWLMRRTRQIITSSVALQCWKSIPWLLNKAALMVYISYLEAWDHMPREVCALDKLCAWHCGCSSRFIWFLSEMLL